jgi:DNA-directed RNA polymerase specialized sigma24 family protein
MKNNLCGNTDQTRNIDWEELYQALRPLIQRLRAEECAEDVLQETMYRMVEYAYKAERGEVKPIRSLQGLALTSARNYQYDLWRKKRRKAYWTTSKYSSVEYALGEEALDAMEIAVENVYREQLFKLLAQEIVHFPPKQKQALLIDLANRMAFGPQQTVLQKAFLEVGVDLQRYQQPLPEDPVEYARYSAILNCAYRRIKQLPSIQTYVKSASRDDDAI